VFKSLTKIIIQIALVSACGLAATSAPCTAIVVPPPPTATLASVPPVVTVQDFIVMPAEIPPSQLYLSWPKTPMRAGIG